MVSSGTSAERAFALAQEQYAEWGVDTVAALERLATVSISLHCWQGDDVGGFENSGQEIGGGLAVTGQYPGKARTADELRRDLERTLSLLPGSHRLNLHASYAETEGRKVERDALEPEHFRNWIEWAKSRRIGMDFNPTFFCTLLGPKVGTRSLTRTRQSKPVLDPTTWIASRRISARDPAGLWAACVYITKRLDSRWLQGQPDRPRRPATAAHRRA